MEIEVYVKSGTGGYFDEDGCDARIIEIKIDNFPIPRIGEHIDILEPNDMGKTNQSGEILKEYHQYLVTDVCYWIGNNQGGVSVYVVPIGRTIPY